MKIEMEKQLDEYFQKEGKSILEKYAQNWLDQQKDALLIQLIGFMNDHRTRLEREIGSGEVQKMEAVCEEGCECCDLVEDQE